MKFKNSAKFVREGVMKSILTIAFLAGGVVCGYSQISNASFETWTDYGSYQNPNGWYTENSLYQPENLKLVQLSTDVSDGFLAVRLENQKSESGNIVRAMMVSGSNDLNHSPGFAYGLKPVSFSGYYQFQSAVNDDSCYIIVRLSKYDHLRHSRVTIGEGVFASNEQLDSYQQFSIPITYNSFDYPDTATIICYSGKMMNPYEGSRLIIDDMRFDESATGVVIIDGDELGVSLTPNPTNTIISIGNSTIISTGRTYSIYDNFGKVMIHKNLNGKYIDVSWLTAGMYYLDIYNSSGNLIGIATFVIS